ncbi:monocarboxylate transporter [Histoplasma capsulatum]|uniref:Monocarboxylate transporter n=2 Tax=Histoplasma TaxID=5036 RepID=A0A8A1MLK5_AJECA|nr:monocarboxylate transporter [Histoplasma capsulatum]
MGVLLQRKPLGWAGFVLGTFFFMWSFLAPFNYLPLMSVATGMSPDLAQYTLTVTNAGSMFGRVGLGAVSDKLGAFNVMCIVTTFTATSVLAFWLPLSNSPSTVGIFMFGGIYGVASGGFISLIAPCVVSLADSQLENLGITFGLVCIGLAFGALVGLPAMAAVKDSATSHSFEELIVFTGAVLAVGSVCMIFSRYMKGGINIWTKV